MMADNVRKLSITYSSGICIRKPEVFATLAVFYDQIWLPHPYGFEWGALFIQGILQTLSPPIPPGNLLADFKTVKADCQRALSQLYGKLDAASEGLHPPYNMGVTKELEDVLLGLHAAYAKKLGPELFISDPADITTSRLAGLLVRSLFEYRLPQLPALTAEQILEVRDYIKDTREGFIDYIFELTDDVEARLRSGDKSEEEAVCKTVERKLLSLYNEMRRQLAAKRTGFWAQLSEAGANFLTIDAVPWTPELYGDLFERLLGSQDEIAQAKAEAQANASQAFQYLARLSRS
jgi:hypothetical protein